MSTATAVTGRNPGKQVSATLQILVIKQTSLGDVLHATGHIRTIKENFPDSELTLLTTSGSYDLYRHNSHIDHVILFEKDTVKRDWWRRPWWTCCHLWGLFRQVRSRRYDLAFDLQGRFRSVVFLYTAPAARKYVKGRWIFLHRFRDRQIHAIEEMSRVLQLAGLTVTDTAMEITTSATEQRAVDDLLARLNPQAHRMVVISPFTRWPTKNWAVQHYRTLIDSLQPGLFVALTGAQESRDDVAALLRGARYPCIANLAGDLTLLEFAELMRRADVVLTGDSFAMHLAGALHRPLVALFGPTDERLVGPVGRHCSVLRDEDCRRCGRRKSCPHDCINRIAPERVLAEVQQWLNAARDP